MDARGLADHSVPPPVSPSKLVVGLSPIALTVGTILGLKVCGVILSIWWGLIAIRLEVRVTQIDVRHESAELRTARRFLGRFAVGLLMACTVLLGSSSLIMVGGEVPQSLPFRCFQAALVFALVMVVLLFAPTLQRASHQTEMPSPMLAATLLRETFEFYKRELKVKVSLPVSAVLVVVFMLVVGGFAPPALGWARVGDGVGMAGVREAVSQVPPFKGMFDKGAERGEPARPAPETTEPPLGPPDSVSTSAPGPKGPRPGVRPRSFGPLRTRAGHQRMAPAGRRR